MLAVAHALVQAKAELSAPLIFMGNVGEEGEGDLRGVRHLYNQDALAGRIAAHIVLDGAGADSAVTQALGSRRFLVAITGPADTALQTPERPTPSLRWLRLGQPVGDFAAGRASHHAQLGTIHGGPA